MPLRKVILLIMLPIFFFSFAYGQKTFGHGPKTFLKTNLAASAFTTLNIGVETELSPRWSLDVNIRYNPFSFSDNMKWRHWQLEHELRHWLFDHMEGHFLGFHTQWGSYNMGGIKNNIRLLFTDYSQLTDYRFQGWFVGTGMGYGYSWNIHRHWNFELEFGMGYYYSQYKKYEYQKCGKFIEKNDKHYIGVTKAAINLIYIF